MVIALLMKNLEKIFSKGLTKAKIESKYNLESSNNFFKNKLELRSKEEAKILTEDNALYKFDKFILFK